MIIHCTHIESPPRIPYNRGCHHLGCKAATILHRFHILIERRYYKCRRHWLFIIQWILKSLAIICLNSYMFRKIKCTNLYWLYTVGFDFTVSFSSNFLFLVHLHFVYLFFLFFSNKKYVHEPYPKIKFKKSNIVYWNWKPHMLNPKRVVYAKQKQPKPLLKTHNYRCLLTQSTTDYQSKRHAWTTFSFYPHQTFSPSKATTDMHGPPQSTTHYQSNP